VIASCERLNKILVNFLYFLYDNRRVEYHTHLWCLPLQTAPIDKKMRSKCMLLIFSSFRFLHFLLFVSINQQGRLLSMLSGLVGEFFFVFSFLWGCNGSTFAKRHMSFPFKTYKHDGQQNRMIRLHDVGIG
jgi:hypothetical protein